MEHLNGLRKIYNKYLTHLCELFGFKINYISLLYIFDEDIQKELKKPNEKSGSKYCIKHKIDFFVYSFSDNSLKKYEPKNI